MISALRVRSIAPLTVKLQNCNKKSICDRGGLRWLQSGSWLLTKVPKGDDKGQLSKLKEDVLRDWVQSVLQTTTNKDAEVSVCEEQFVKRPPVANFTSSSKPASLPNGRRRKLTDNMWTSEAMDDKIIWVDCEMTGLNPEEDKLMEIGIIITDANLNVIAEHDSVVFHVEEPILKGMDPWCQKHHGESGLTETARKSTITHPAADETLLAFLEAHTKPGECPMAGNSIGQDRMFIRRQLPKFYKHFHYRSIDVSTIKELVRRWYPEVMSHAPRKKYSHRVLDDIMESIEELKFYRSTIFSSKQDAQNKATEIAKTQTKMTV